MPGEDEIKRLKKEITRANTAKEIAKARAEYIRLREEDDWHLTNRARNDAMPILRAMEVTFPTQYAVVEKILHLLRVGHPMKAIGMGDPAGVHGIAHVMKGGYVEDVYIKIKIEDNQAYILSFHR